MPILDVQRRVAIIGHIRLGERTDGRPRALKGFRFTSPRVQLIESVASVYGGECVPWHNPSTNLDEYEVLTNADALEVLIPPADLAFSQHYELWSADGCQRRCDGFTESRGNEPRPCVCAQEGVRTCNSVTRMSLLLPRVAHVFGVWQLVTNSYYASGELLSAVELALGMAQRRAEHLAYGTLRIEQRVAKKTGEQPHRYIVPVLDVALDLGALGAREPVALPTAPEDAAQAAAALTVVGLPEPAPRIDRGAHVPAPGPLGDEGARAPAITVPTSTATLGALAVDTPDVGTVADDEAALARSGITYERVDNVPEPNAEFRYLFAVLGEVWPELEPTELDERRHALACVATKGRVASWAELEPDERDALTRRVQQLKGGGMTMSVDAGGYVFTLANTGRTVLVKKDAQGVWQYQPQPIREADDESF